MRNILLDLMLKLKIFFSLFKKRINLLFQLVIISPNHSIKLNLSLNIIVSLHIKNLSIPKKIASINKNFNILGVLFILFKNINIRILRKKIFFHEGSILSKLEQILIQYNILRSKNLI